jgi:hypothetical protein
MEYEHRIVIEYGGVDGVFGRETRNLGSVSEERARAHAQLMVVEHAREVHVQRREVGPWLDLDDGIVTRARPPEPQASTSDPGGTPSSSRPGHR